MDDETPAQPESEPETPPEPSAPSIPDDPAQGFGALETEWKGDLTGGESVEDAIRRPGTERRG